MTRTDEQIKTNIVTRLSWDARVDASNVMVAVKNGTVHLEGTVPLYPSLTVVLNTVAETPGVVDIDSQLSVTFSETQLNSGDKTLQQQAEYVIEHSADLQDCNIVVAVDKAVIVISGLVQFLWQREKAADLVSNLTGVRGIENIITVIPTYNPTDEAIAEVITTELKHSNPAHFENISICVQEGKVKLSGTVPHYRDTEYAFKVASYTPGTKGVDNQLDVKYET